MCKRITDIVRTLRVKRDMSLNEIRLTLAIEDPVAKERRDYLDVSVRHQPPQFVPEMQSSHVSIDAQELLRRMPLEPLGMRSRQRCPQLQLEGYPRIA